MTGKIAGLISAYVISPSKLSLISSDNVGMPVYGISFFRFILLTVNRKF
jgi:hypothetical protein